jgi:hypothetical protein
MFRGTVSKNANSHERTLPCAVRTIQDPIPFDGEAFLASIAVRNFANRPRSGHRTGGDRVAGPGRKASCISSGSDPDQS